jgi:hypothetical protein
VTIIIADNKVDDVSLLIHFWRSHVRFQAPRLPKIKLQVAHGKAPHMVVGRAMLMDAGDLPGSQPVSVQVPASRQHTS